MTVQITSIADAGKLDKERVVMKVSSDDDMTSYAVFAAFSGDMGALSGNIPNAYWFQAWQVKRGDFVVLYTKVGTESQKKNANGTTSHFFYWGLSFPLWTTGKIAALVETPSWQYSDPIK
jgi:hypothetical protein